MEDNKLVASTAIGDVPFVIRSVDPRQNRPEPPPYSEPSREELEQRLSVLGIPRPIRSVTNWRTFSLPAQKTALGQSIERTRRDNNHDGSIDVLDELASSPGGGRATGEGTRPLPSTPMHEGHPRESMHMPTDLSYNEAREIENTSTGMRPYTSRQQKMAIMSRSGMTVVVPSVVNGPSAPMARNRIGPNPYRIGPSDAEIMGNLRVSADDNIAEPQQQPRPSSAPVNDILNQLNNLPKPPSHGGNRRRPLADERPDEVDDNIADLSDRLNNIGKEEEHNISTPGRKAAIKKDSIKNRKSDISEQILNLPDARNLPPGVKKTLVKNVDPARSMQFRNGGLDNVNPESPLMARPGGSRPRSSSTTGTIARPRAGTVIRPADLPFAGPLLPRPAPAPGPPAPAPGPPAPARPQRQRPGPAAPAGSPTPNVDPLVMLGLMQQRSYRALADMKTARSALDLYSRENISPTYLASPGMIQGVAPASSAPTPVNVTQNVNIDKVINPRAGGGGRRGRVGRVKKPKAAKPSPKKK